MKNAWNGMNMAVTMSERALSVVPASNGRSGSVAPGEQTLGPVGLSRCARMGRTLKDADHVGQSVDLEWRAFYAGFFGVGVTL
jgi:hypothetical protein